MPSSVFRHTRHNVGINLNEILACHAGLTGNTGSDNYNIRPSGIFIPISAYNAVRKAQNGGGLQDVKSFALRQALNDVQNDHIGKVLLGKTLSEQTGVELDRAGRISVNPDLTLDGHPEIFVVGDMINLIDPRNGKSLPGVAQVAIQGGKYAAKTIKARLKGAEGLDKPFKYFDKGSMATISRFQAVLKVGSLEMSGFLAWVGWLAVHLAYLTGFRNRVSATMHWINSFVLGSDRGERTVTMQQVLARNALQRQREEALAAGTEVR